MFITHSVFLCNTQHGPRESPQVFLPFIFSPYGASSRAAQVCSPLWRLRDALPLNMAAHAGVCIYLRLVSGLSEARKMTDEKWRAGKEKSENRMKIWGQNDWLFLFVLFCFAWVLAPYVALRVGFSSRTLHSFMSQMLPCFCLLLVTIQWLERVSFFFF